MNCDYIKPLVVSLFMLVTPSLIAQNGNTEDSLKVYETVLQLFDGMREGDSAKVHRCFSNSVQLISTSTNKDGEEKVHRGNLQQFLNGVGKPHTEIWDERLSNVSIHVDGAVAQLWTDYQFYVGDSFSHCGVDAFNLVKKDGRWKIVSLLDTRRKVGCNQ